MTYSRAHSFVLVLPGRTRIAPKKCSCFARRCAAFSDTSRQAFARLRDIFESKMVFHYSGRLPNKWKAEMTKKKERGRVNEKNVGQSQNDRSILASCIVSEPELRNQSAPWGAYIWERLWLGVRGRGTEGGCSLEKVVKRRERAETGQADRLVRSRAEVQLRGSSLVCGGSHEALLFSVPGRTVGTST